MERIQALISRLQEQLSQHADTGQMMATVQLLQQELNRAMSNSGKVLGTSKVAVLMPSVSGSLVEEEKKNIPAATIQKPQPTKEADFSFDPIKDIPTLSQHQIFKEVNESITKSESLNDKLKEEKTEVMQVLKDSPIRDLRKAIGINDQFVFINELFRGDEAMYERSVKTLNNFSIYPEAESWMNRELKTKLGWNENLETVKHFYQLVKRRFS